MKKIITLILILTVTSTLFCACNRSQAVMYQTYNSYISDIANDGVLSSAEVSFWDSCSWKDEEFTNTIHTVEFNGITYSGVYKSSTIDNYNSYISDTYMTEEMYQFSVRRDTKELIHINFVSQKFLAAERLLEDVSDPEATAQSIAKQIASQYLTNPNSYKISIGDTKTVSGSGSNDSKPFTIHYVTFAKEHFGYESSDYMTVRVTSKGHILSVNIHDIGVFDDKNINVDTALLEKSISEKVASTYAQTNFTVTNYTVERQILCISTENEICICSSIKVSLLMDDSIEMESGILIVTTIGKL